MPAILPDLEDEVPDGGIRGETSAGNWVAPKYKGKSRQPPISGFFRRNVWKTVREKRKPRPGRPGLPYVSLSTKTVGQSSLSCSAPLRVTIAAKTRIETPSLIARTDPSAKTEFREPTWNPYGAEVPSVP